MTPALSFEIPLPCNPQGKERPRHGKGRTYTPKKTKGYEGWCAVLAQEAMKQAGAKPFQGPVGMHLRFDFVPPTSWSKAKKAREKWCIGRSDLDNLVKAVCDSFNGVLYDDDRQVVSLTCSKQYRPDEASVFVQIWRMG